MDNDPFDTLANVKLRDTDGEIVHVSGFSLYLVNRFGPKPSRWRRLVNRVLRFLRLGPRDR